MVRKYVLMPFIAFSLGEITAVNAATKCVALTPGIKCTASGNESSADWSATCTTNGISTSIQGVASCSTQYGGSPLPGTSDTLSISSSADNCWCKMVRPAVSPWVFAFNAGSGACASSCATICADMFVGEGGDNGRLHYLMLSGLGD